MINPVQIEFYDAEEAKLQEFLLFCLFVANKKADKTAEVLEKFLGRGSGKVRPFDILCSIVYNYQYQTLKDRLIRCKTGQYGRLEKALNTIHYNYEAGIKHFNDLKNISFDELLSVPGIGRKTANYFLLYTRKDYQGVVLDTHVCKYLRTLGFNAPKNTPQSKKKYDELQSIFIGICNKSKIRLSDADLNIWKFYAGRDYDKNKIPCFRKLKNKALKPLDSVDAV